MLNVNKHLKGLGMLTGLNLVEALNRPDRNPDLIKDLGDLLLGLIDAPGRDLFPRRLLFESE